jgi:hypothetical protein
MEGFGDGFTVRDELLGLPEKKNGLHASWNNHRSNHSCD